MNLNIQDYSIFPPKIPGNWNMGCQSSCYFAPDGRFCWGMLYRLVRVIRDGVDPTHPLPRPRRGYQGTPKTKGLSFFLSENYHELGYIRMIYPRYIPVVIIF
jgi:hypothetical protein